MESDKKAEKNWIKVYPIYLDKNAKCSEGRKVSLENAPEDPSAKDIYSVCNQFLNINAKIEPKSHPKDWMKRGRVIIELKKDGKSLCSEAQNKNQLLKIIGQTIIKYKVKPEEKPQEERKKRKKKK